tara:strand:+ start:25795 stop:26508 length:714 start_codon:yes stop_codon:yes gene_type:complete
MHKILIIQAFNKAKSLRQKQGDKKPSLTHLAEDLAIFVEETEGLGLNEKSYRIYHGDSIKLDATSKDISIKQLKIVNGLSKYLGHSNYEDFVNSLGNKSFIKTFCDFFRNNKVLIIILFFLLVGLMTYYSINKERWMVWDKDHYIETSFDVKKYNIGELKLYNKHRIKYFRKIIPNNETVFFGSEKKVLIWYGKNKKNELEYFTALGLHPETGKTLHPITEYMIVKYVYSDYKNDKN